MLEQGNLFTPRRFEGADQQSKFAELRLETAAEYLEGQGIPPLFIAAALSVPRGRFGNRALSVPFPPLTGFLSVPPSQPLLCRGFRNP